ncbi:MAG: RHS repeat protein, partial [Gammaproteobacteria bacterium]|nr:RHS repeat protein [Gammaproteobacteria bacterium]
LTTLEGYEFYLKQGAGLKQVKDPNGHTLTYSSNGIIHSAGKSLQFVRDGTGRIAEIIDPMGHKLVYTRDARGDLTTAAGRDGYTVSYAYNDRHALTEIKDPLGRTSLRNIYNDEGRLIAQADANGNRTEFNHNLDGRRSVVTDRLGRITQLFYDEQGNVLNRVDPLGGIHKSAYDRYGNRLSYTNPLGHTETTAYDAKFRVTSQTDAEGHTILYSYIDQQTKPDGGILQHRKEIITDTNNNVFEQSYDDSGFNLTKLHLPGGISVSNQIKPNGLVEATTDALGNITRYTYDAYGNNLAKTDPLGNTVEYTYDDNGNPLSETRVRTVNGEQVTETAAYQYDTRNRVIKIIYADGNAVRTEYNALGLESAGIDAAGKRTEYEYDVYGNLAETRYPDSTKESRTYDAENNLLSVTDRAGQVTKHEYDLLDRLVKTIYPDNSFAQTEYDAAGNVLAEADVNGNRTEYLYDKNGQLVQIKDALGNLTEFSYDSEGNPARKALPAEDGQAIIIAYEYDALGRQVKTAYNPGTAEELSNEQVYDNAGNLIREIDLAGKATDFGYDASGRLKQVKQVLDGETLVTRFDYDEAGNRIRQIDALGRVTAWTHDSAGRILSRTLPLGMSEHFVYNRQTGNLARHTDFNGQTATFGYDLNTDQLSEVAYADGRKESFVYDAAGNRIQARDPHGVTSYAYDVSNRLKTVSRNGIALTYGYDNAGNRTGLTLTGADFEQNVSYAYDALNRLKSVQGSQGKTLYAYTAAGSRQSVSYPNGVTTRYAYDKLNRLTSLTVRKADNSILAGYSGTLYPNGLQAQVTEHIGRTIDYTYDDLYRLSKKSVNDNGVIVDFSYQHDKAGNVVYSMEDEVHAQYAYDSNDRLLKRGDTEYSYDDNGNLLSVAYKDSIVNYAWDGAGQLVKADIAENGQTKTVAYVYDAD